MNRLPILIIAEAGVNHNGNVDIAKKLIDAAVESGADIIKFQTYITDSLVVPSAPKAIYQKEQDKCSINQCDMLRKLEISSRAFEDINHYCSQKNIIFLSSPFDLLSVEFLAKLCLKIIKIPSGEITNIPYLRKIASYKWKVILSTGMSTLGDVETALDVLELAGKPRDQITLLHCTTEYPAPLNEVNLLAMRTLASAFPGIHGVGYSDHTQGITIALAAAALGARVIEKHFTLNRQMEGPDHKASLEPKEFACLVRGIREIEEALGDSIKKPSPSERLNISAVRKSLVAARNIREGELFTEENLTVKRPGSGISPIHWDEYIGTPASRALHKDELL